jgi:hypothetical protein
VARKEKANPENDCASGWVFDNVAPPQDASLGHFQCPHRALAGLSPPGLQKSHRHHLSM